MIDGHWLDMMSEPLQPSSTIVQERRSERMEQRVRPTMKQAIETAAASLGQDLSEFVTNAAYERAVAVLESRLVTRLPLDQFAAFTAALGRPARSNERLDALMADYEAGVDEPIR